MADYEVVYHPAVVEADLKKIPKNLLARIFKAIEERLMTAPAHFGLHLRRPLTGLWRLRVGDYRVVYSLHAERVWICAVAHRKEVYSAVVKRWMGRHASAH